MDGIKIFKSLINIYPSRLFHSNEYTLSIPTKTEDSHPTPWMFILINGGYLENIFEFSDINFENI